MAIQAAICVEVWLYVPTASQKLIPLVQFSTERGVINLSHSWKRRPHNLTKFTARSNLDPSVRVNAEGGQRLL